MSGFFNLLGNDIIKPTYKVLVSGDSTLAVAECRTQTIADTLFTNHEKNLGNSAYNIAVPGHTINQQLSYFNALNSSLIETFDFIIVQVGLNNCANTDSSIPISQLQNYVDAINLKKRDNAKVILSCMLPCKARWQYVNDMGIVINNPIQSQQTWIDINKAIMNENSVLSNIQNVDFRNNYHVNLMDDGSGNLKTIYDCGDYIHENQEGANVMIEGYKKIIFP